MPIHYEIRVRETLRDSWSKWFDDFAITHDSGGDTIITGEVIDEAAFYSLISRARDLGLTVLSVKRG